MQQLDRDVPIGIIKNEYDIKRKFEPLVQHH